MHEVFFGTEMTQSWSNQWTFLRRKHLDRPKVRKLKSTTRPVMASCKWEKLVIMVMVFPHEVFKKSFTAIEQERAICLLA